MKGNGGLLIASPPTCEEKGVSFTRQQPLPGIGDDSPIEPHTARARFDEVREALRRLWATPPLTSAVE